MKIYGLTIIYTGGFYTSIDDEVRYRESDVLLFKDKTKRDKGAETAIEDNWYMKLGLADTTKDEQGFTLKDALTRFKLNGETTICLKKNRRIHFDTFTKEV